MATQLEPSKFDAVVGHVATHILSFSYGTLPGHVFKQVILFTTIDAGHCAVHTPSSEYGAVPGHVDTHVFPLK